jgi:hypothetical protein
MRALDEQERKMRADFAAIQNNQEQLSDIDRQLRDAQQQRVELTKALLNVKKKAAGFLDDSDTSPLPRDSKKQRVAAKATAAKTSVPERKRQPLVKSKPNVAGSGAKSRAPMKPELDPRSSASANPVRRKVPTRKIKAEIGAVKGFYGKPADSPGNNARMINGHRPKAAVAKARVNGRERASEQEGQQDADLRDGHSAELLKQAAVAVRAAVAMSKAGKASDAKRPTPAISKATPAISKAKRATISVIAAPALNPYSSKVSTDVADASICTRLSHDLTRPPCSVSYCVLCR